MRQKVHFSAIKMTNIYLCDFLSSFKKLFFIFEPDNGLNNFVLENVWLSLINFSVFGLEWSFLHQNASTDQVESFGILFGPIRSLLDTFKKVRKNFSLGVQTKNTPVWWGGLWHIYTKTEKSKNAFCSFSEQIMISKVL